jgi:uncharacterized protein with HEPN domain
MCRFVASRISWRTSSALNVNTKGYDFERFHEDQQCRDAVERCLARISEAAKKLEGIVDTVAPDVPWPDIRGLGNVLRHEYDNVYPDSIWAIVVNDLRPLKQAVAAIIRSSRPGGGPP